MANYGSWRHAVHPAYLLTVFLFLSVSANGDITDQNPAEVHIARDQHDGETMRLHRKTLSEFQQFTVSTPAPTTAHVPSFMTDHPTPSPVLETTPLPMQRTLLANVGSKAKNYYTHHPIQSKHHHSLTYFIRRKTHNFRPKPSKQLSPPTPTPSKQLSTPTPSKQLSSPTPTPSKKYPTPQPTPSNKLAPPTRTPRKQPQPTISKVPQVSKEPSKRHPPPRPTVTTSSSGSHLKVDSPPSPPGALPPISSPPDAPTTYAYRSPTHAPRIDKAGAVFGQVPLRYYEGPEGTRTGYYVLPPNWRNRKLPVMLLFHGLAGFGGTMGGRRSSDRGILGTGSGLTFLEMSKKYGYITVAPDSQTASKAGWEVPLSTQDPTADMIHAMACLEYVLGLEGVQYDPRHVVAAGYSNGGKIAVPIASRYPIFTHAMSFHSRFRLDMVQGNSVPLWMSTGAKDGEIPPATVQNTVDSFHKEYFFWPKIMVRVDYPEGHSLTYLQERIDALNWWLGL